MLFQIKNAQKPNKTQTPIKPQKPVGLGYFKTPGFLNTDIRTDFGKT